MHRSAKKGTRPAPSCNKRSTDSQRRGGEDGAALILALVFVVVSALSVAALVTFSGGALLSTAQFKSERNIEYAADSAVELAIQQVRYRPSYYPTATPRNCLGPGSVTVDHKTIVVLCKGELAHLPISVSGVGSGSTTTNSVKITTAALFAGTHNFVGFLVRDSRGYVQPTSTVVHETNAQNSATLSLPAVGTTNGSDGITLTPPYERLVTFYACAYQCTHPTGAISGSHVVIKAVVGFDDLTARGGSACATTPTTPKESSASTCGTAITVRQWVVEPAND